MHTYQCDKLSKDFQDRVDHLDAYCRDKGFHAWFETSAKEDIGIDEAIRCLAAKVLIDVVVHMYVSFLIMEHIYYICSGIGKCFDKGGCIYKKGVGTKYEVQSVAECRT